MTMKRKRKKKKKKMMKMTKYPQGTKTKIVKVSKG
jgi:hypothetical protein